MSIRIALDRQPEFYTNLDVVTGRIILALNRAEQVGSIVVKLEGESITALQIPHPQHPDSIARHGPPPGPPGSLASENHKILYQVQQVFPDDYHQSSASPYGSFPLQPGEHEFPFKFKLPVNNACGNPIAMSKLGGMGGLGGFGSGPGLFGMGGVRVMDGTKQLFLSHVTRTLPPSLTGYPMEAEIRYYVKVTVQRPGFLKENWRYQVGFKFLPIEPPRPKGTGQEAFARRPFTFRPRSPGPPEKKSFFTRKSEKGDSGVGTPGLDGASPPSIEISARLPHPTTLTCNQPIPLRLIAKKLVESPEVVHLISFQMNLVGFTEIRAHNIFNKETNNWVVISQNNINIPIQFSPQDGVGTELVLPDEMWKHTPLPNTIAPSFATCNLGRRYEIEIRIGLSWGLAGGHSSTPPQTIYLPLRFQKVQVYSGITPPPELLEAARNRAPGEATINVPPQLPPRTSQAGRPGMQPGQSSQSVRPPQPAHDPLYPPQLAPGEVEPPYDDAPPSYDEAVAENLTGPFDGLQSRPAYSGVTNENAPSQMPSEKGR
ncbi:hypothetical protein HJFPF1_03675 [Paramyrothecium foliicola]|nr:hypothetical protein HJFPF1_03675 [Paramyrothecium foliicola]